MTTHSTLPIVWEQHWITCRSQYDRFRGLLTCGLRIVILQRRRFVGNDQGKSIRLVRDNKLGNFYAD